MDTQLVLPGQVRLSPECAPPADKGSRECQERISGMRLPMPRISDESLQERLRSLEIECQQLRDSNSRLELENSRLKLQVSSSQATSEQPESPSRLSGSISVAETHHQVLRARMRAMLEEQKQLVDELQREIAEVQVPRVNVGKYKSSGAVLLCSSSVARKWANFRFDRAQSTSRSPSR